MSHKSLLDPVEPTVDEVGSNPAPGDPALAIVDEALTEFAARTFISRDDVVNRLLDLRNALEAATLLRELDARRPARR